jgi:transcriptional regulator with XRE-family HTH domain
MINKRAEVVNRASVAHHAPPGASAQAEAAGFSERLMAVRRNRRLTLDQIAQMSGLSKSYLSKVERKQAVPSITTVIKVAKALDMRVSELLGEPPPEVPILVVRKGTGREFVAGGEVFNTHYALAADRAVKIMEPFLLRPPHGYDAATYDSDTAFSFQGEHFCYALSGLIEIDFPDRLVRLAPGDSIYFDSKIPHRTRSVGDQPGEILVVIATAR